MPRSQNIVHILRKTVEEAISSTSFYAKHYESHDIDFVDVEGFARLPLINSETVIEHGLKMMPTDAFPEYVSITSGSTFGKQRSRPFYRFRSSTESKALGDFAKRVALSGARSETPEVAPLTLHLLNGNHGLSPNLPHPGTFTLPLEKYYHFVAILDVLKRTFEYRDFSPHIEIISGTTNQLRLLTLLCIEHEVDPHTLAIKAIGTGGWQLTDRWRELFEDYWQVPIVDHYGLGEIPGLVSHRFTNTQPFEFSPSSYIEFLAVNGNESVNSGYGRLISTAYYPISELQPVIRYDTDDIVALSKTHITRPQAHYIGRQKDVLLNSHNGKQELLWAPLVANNVLDSIPDIASVQNPRASVIPLSLMFGWQKYKTHFSSTEEKQLISLDIELRWSPHQFLRPAKQLTSRIHDALLSAQPMLARAVTDQRVTLDIRLHEPGSTNFTAVF